MGFARRTLRFGGGLMLGAAISSALSLLLAPRSGQELQATIADRREAARRAGEEAELLETERLKRIFRVAVNDPVALTGKYGAEKAALVSPDQNAIKQERQARKEEQEAEKARREAQKAEEQLRKVEAQVQAARERAAKEAAEAAQARERVR